MASPSPDFGQSHFRRWLNTVHADADGLTRDRIAVFEGYAREWAGLEEAEPVLARWRAEIRRLKDGSLTYHEWKTKVATQRVITPALDAAAADLKERFTRSLPGETVGLIKDIDAKLGRYVNRAPAPPEPRPKVRQKPSRIREHRRDRGSRRSSAVPTQTTPVSSWQPWALWADQRWIVVGDESGSAMDHVGVESDGHGATWMVFVSIPPGCKLPALPRGFHTKTNRAEGRRAVEALLAHDDIHIFGFRYESGGPSPIRHGAGGDFHLELWRTLALVLEPVVQDVVETTHVVAMVEQVSALNAGDPTLVGWFAEVYRLLQGRHGWTRMIMHGPDIVAKDHHPWLGYADAVAAILRFALDAEDQRLARRVEARHNTWILPYDQATIDQLMMVQRLSGPAPLHAIEYLIAHIDGVEIEQWWTVIEPMVFEALDRLNTEDWIRLGESIRFALRNLPASHETISWLLLDGVDPERLQTFVTGPPYLTLLDSMLESANHHGDPELADDFLALWAEHAASHGQPSVELQHRHAVLEADRHANVCAFETALARVDDALAGDLHPENTTPGHAALLGARVQYLAFLGRTEEALEVWKLAWAARVTPQDGRRLLIYRAYILMDANRHREALTDLNAVVGHGDDPPLEAISDACLASPFLLAGLLRAWTALPNKTPARWKELIPERPPARHPYPSVLFWATRLGLARHGMKSARHFARLLLDLVVEGGVRSGVLGLTVAAYLYNLDRVGVVLGKELKPSIEARAAVVRGTLGPWMDGRWGTGCAEGEGLGVLTFNYR